MPADTTTLAPGTRLGPFELVALLGAGGMGQVYRARDTRLDRDVALKLLPEAFAADPERLARFQREAKTLAALNHPHIAQIFGIEDAGANRALVMELVEGADLAALIARGPIPLADALTMARQVAEALEAAHEQGIIHRDLKPANIRVRPDGTVKVLDFGLAKAMNPGADDPGLQSAGQGGITALANSPTLTAAGFAGGTQLGVILGTAAYMAPEQAKGRPVDRRADVWAFGVVLHEMLTGRRLFAAEDVSETLAAVLTRDVSAAALPPDTPERVRALLRDCLVRDPRQRLRDIGEARRAIEQQIARPLDEAAVVSPVSSSSSAPAQPLWRRVLPWAIGAAGMLGVWVASRPAPVADIPTTRAVIELPDGLSVVQRDRGLALSPDGTQLALVLVDGRNQSQLYLRALDRLEMRGLPNTDGATYPFWSPDGRALGFFAGDQLKRLDLADGLVRVMAPAPFARGGSWGPDDTAVYAGAADQAGIAARLFRVSMATPGRGTPVGPEPTESVVMRLPVFAGAGGVLFERLDRLQPAMSELHYLDLGSGQTRRVAGQMGEVHYVAPGWLASVADSILTVRAFDARSMSLSGAPIVLASGVVADELRGTAHVSFGREAGSSAVYLQAPPAPMRQLAWMDAEGQATTPIGEPARLRLIAPSPDGRRAIVGIETQERAPLPQLWMMDLSTGVRAPFTAAGEGGVSVAWSPDGRRVAYRADDGRAVVRSTDGGSDRVILGDPLDNNSPSAWTPDGMSVVMGIYRGLRGTDLAVMPADGQGAPRYLTESPALEMAGAISRDGRWLAYLSNESGRFEVYLTAFGVAGPRWVLTTAGAQDFAWSADRAITYRAPDGRIAQVSWQFQGDRVEVAPARPVLGARDLADAVLALAPTSGRYLVAQPLPGQPLRRSLVLATNWQAEISRPSR